ncbi:MAG: TVP38/TMEM64 family protein [Candidatus Mcinerneyibacterium aminivorans]|jgi:uncharacterized membrane protein YdjX (TVP38/TMEM64 family)|uniref:TVP38/TMEM64 family membrane protein n=1 Tax=Candidatus Mcinerneyibacterium aminivorans TaxID=2703815 RepID=A0A5D0MBA8_9BACT|nr:MAG: TVP38/TMEM64 family protein [Candidatus Mcinerneyibacterium aminivorans]
MVRRKIIKKFVIFISILILLNAFFLIKYSNFITNVEQLRNFILKYDYDQVVYVVLIIVQVLISLIPGQIFGLAGGFLYGPLLGTIYSMIGLLFGSSIAFLLSRKLGRPFVENVVKKEKIEKYDSFVLKNGKLTLFLIFLFPALPDDLICFIAGISRIKFKNFILITFLGRLPGFLVLNFIGAEIIDQTRKEIFMIVFVLISMTIIFIRYKMVIEKYIKKLIQKIG